MHVKPTVDSGSIGGPAAILAQDNILKVDRGF
jgi:hypothetical protein